MSYRETKRVLKAGRKIMAGALAFALIASFLAALAAEASPQFHRWLHHDADDSDHHCLVTLLADGKISTPEIAAVAAFVSAIIFRVALPRIRAFPARMLWRASLGRAPPSSIH